MEGGAVEGLSRCRDGREVPIVLDSAMNRSGRVRVNSEKGRGWRVCSETQNEFFGTFSPKDFGKTRGGVFGSEGVSRSKRGGIVPRLGEPREIEQLKIYPVL